MEKNELRQWIREKKRRYTADERAAFSASVWTLLEEHRRFRSARTVLIYYSLPDEVQTHNFLNRWCTEKRLLLPVVKGDDLELRVYGGEDRLHTGAYGISEPAGVAVTDYSAIDLAIVPGMAFDAEGNRLGRGKGYYDRLLERLRRSGVYIIGICFGFQKVEAVPYEPHDVRMDEVISDTVSGR